MIQKARDNLIQILILLRRIQRSVYLFPLIVVLGLLLLTVFRINGSSIGLYDRLLEPDIKNNSVGAPRQIRSDEWTVNTPFILAQDAENYPKFNSNIGNGQNMSVILDVPYKDWSVLFKPQNLVFFAMPLDQAFAFKWWSLSALLALSVYCFLVTLYPKKRLLAATLGAIMVMSPFIQWWYQSITILPIAYTLIAVALAHKLLLAPSFLRKLIFGFILSYVLVCFALVMYPPFQIPAGLVGVSIFAALIASNPHLMKKARELKFYGVFIGILVMSALFVLLYYIQNKPAIEAITNSSYPGDRIILSGTAIFADTLIWPLNFLQLVNGPSTIFGSNQSEMSRFLLFGVFMIPLIAFRLFVRPTTSTNTSTNRTLKGLFVGSMIIFTLLIIRQYVPYFNDFFEVILLGDVPHNRLFIAYGIINVVLLFTAMALPGIKNPTLKQSLNIQVLIMSLVSLLLMLASLVYAREHYAIANALPLFLIAAVSVVCAISVGLISSPSIRVRYFGLYLILFYGVASSLPVHPVRIGMGSITNSQLVSTIKSMDEDSQKRWITDDNLELESVLLAAGTKGLGGIYTYPQLELWEAAFPNDRDIYNRFAHVSIDINDQKDKKSIELIQPDFFKITLNSCDPYLKQMSVGYVVVRNNIENPETYTCMELVTEIGENRIYRLAQ